MHLGLVWANWGWVAVQQQISSMPVSSSGRKEGKQIRSLSLPGVTRQFVGEIKLTLCSTVIHVANHRFSSRTFIMVNFFCYEWNFFVVHLIKGVRISLSSLSVYSFSVKNGTSVIETGMSNKRDLGVSVKGTSSWQNCSIWNILQHEYTHHFLRALTGTSRCSYWLMLTLQPY